MLVATAFGAKVMISALLYALQHERVMIELIIVLMLQPDLLLITRCRIRAHLTGDTWLSLFCINA